MFLLTSFEEAKVTHTSLASSVWQTIVYKVEFMTRAQNLKNKMRKLWHRVLISQFYWMHNYRNVVKCQEYAFLFQFGWKKLVKSQNFQRIVFEAIDSSRANLFKDLYKDIKITLKPKLDQSQQIWKPNKIPVKTQNQPCPKISFVYVGLTFD